jgi:cellulose biosynthesis protein BcsQ
MIKIHAKKNTTPTTTKIKYDQLETTSARAVCFFNNKGGVGKTTLVANLAAQLSLFEGFRILVVDADPQCNLTQYVLTDDEFADIYEKDPIEETIYSVIHPLSIGKGYSNNLPIRKTKNFGFDTIIGDPRLALKEDLLAQDWRDAKAGGTRGLRTTFVFSDLITKAKDNYDFIFFDMGPSLGAINRAVLLAANYFVIPMSIDIFSIWAIKNIGEALKIWERDVTNGIRLAEDPKEIINHQVNADRVGFLGYVTQQHKEKSEGGSTRIVEAYRAIQERMPQEIEKILFDFYGKGDFKPSLGTIKHLASLAPKSQTLHSPMINVSLKGSYTTTRKQAREVYQAIATQFIENFAAHEKSS